MKTHSRSRLLREHDYLLRGLLHLHTWLNAKCLRGERVWPSEILEKLAAILGGL